MLPLLGTDFLSSPTAGGVVSGKTADLLAQSGSQMAQRIEQGSQVAEAQMKAPAISNSYSTAYQKIAQGDFTGFADMQQARSLAIGNPILMKSMDEADKLAGTLANEWTRTQLAKMQIDKAYNIQDLISRRQLTATEHHDDRTFESIDSSNWRNDHTAWEHEVLQSNMENARNQQKWQEAQNTENMMAGVQGREAKQIPKPDPIVPRPEPVRPAPRSRLSYPDVPAPLPGQGADLQNLDLPSPTPGPASSSDGMPVDSSDPLDLKKEVESNALTPPTNQVTINPRRHSTAAPMPSTSNIPQPSLPELSSTDSDTSSDAPQASSPSTVVPIPPQGTPLNAKNPMPFGSIAFHFNAPANEMSETTLDSNGKASQKWTPNKEQKEFLELTNVMEGTNPAFVNFFANSKRAGERMQLVPVSDGTPGKKGEIQNYIAVSGGDTLMSPKIDPTTGQPMRDPTGKIVEAPMMLQETGDKEKPGVVDLFKKALAVMPHAGVQFEHPQLTDPDQIAAFRQHALADAVADPTNGKLINKINAQLKSFGVPELDPDEVVAKYKQAAAAAAAPAIAAKNDAWQARVQARINDLDPSHKAPDSDSLQQTAGYLKELDELPAKIASVKARAQAVAGSGTQESKDLAANLITLEDRYSALNGRFGGWPVEARDRVLKAVGNQ